MNEKELLMKLLNYDTQNVGAEEDSEGKHPGKTLEMLNFIKTYLESKGAEVRIIEYETQGLGERGVLIANRKGAKDNFILLQGHADTVPFNRKKWNYNPLGEIDEKDEDIIWGRGTVDMKGPLTGLIKALEELLNKKLNYEPLLVITSDEEARFFQGIKEFFQNYQELNKIKFGVCAEPSDFKLFTYQKGLMMWTIKTEGVEAHGSKPHKGVNAIYKMVPVLNDLMRFKEFVHSQKTKELENSTMNLGMIRGGVKTNQVPGECVANFEVRLTVDSRIIEKGFKQIVNTAEADYQILFKKNPVTINTENQFVQKLSRELKRKEKKVNYSIMTGFTEASFLNSEGIPTIVFGPGDFELAHSEGKEKIDIDDIITYKEIIKKLFEE